MTAIVSSLGLLVLGCVLLCQSMGSDGSARVTWDGQYSVYQCENANIILQCTYTTNIKVVSACYGGDKRICAPKDNRCSDQQYFSSVIDKVTTQCDGQWTCHFNVSKRILGNPLYPENGIFLKVKYNCEPKPSGDMYKAYICEGNYLTLDCPNANQKVMINTAQYGRTGSNRCNPDVLGINKNRNTCRNDVTDKLKTLCDGKWQCHFKVTSDQFIASNRCEGVYKYLEVQYYCH